MKKVRQSRKTMWIPFMNSPWDENRNKKFEEFLKLWKKKNLGKWMVRRGLELYPIADPGDLELFAVIGSFYTFCLHYDSINNAEVPYTYFRKWAIMRFRSMLKEYIGNNSYVSGNLKELPFLDRLEEVYRAKMRTHRSVNNFDRASDSKLPDLDLTDIVGVFKAEVKAFYRDIYSVEIPDEVADAYVFVLEESFANGWKKKKWIEVTNVMRRLGVNIKRKPDSLHQEVLEHVRFKMWHYRAWFD